MYEALTYTKDHNLLLYKIRDDDLIDSRKVLIKILLLDAAYPCSNGDIIVIADGVTSYLKDGSLKEIDYPGNYLYSAFTNDTLATIYRQGEKYFLSIYNHLTGFYHRTAISSSYIYPSLPTGLIISEDSIAVTITSPFTTFLTIFDYDLKVKNNRWVEYGTKPLVFDRDGVLCRSTNGMYHGTSSGYKYLPGEYFFTRHGETKTYYSYPDYDYCLPESSNDISRPYSLFHTTKNVDGNMIYFHRLGDY